MLRRSLLSKSGGILPSDFIQLEYIENSSNAYIDTRHKPTNNTKIECNFHCADLYTSYQGVFGCRIENYSNSYSLWLVGDNTVADDYGNNLAGTIINNAKALEKHIVIKDKNSTYYDSNILIHDKSNYTANNLNLYVYCCNRNGEAETGWAAKIKLYSFKIWEDNKEVRNYIPAKRKSDNAVGLYDTINDTFSLSPNGTPFGSNEGKPILNETININLKSSDTAQQSKLNGTTINVSYAGFNKNYTWNGNTIKLEIPQDNNVTVSYSNVANFTKPANSVFKTVGGNTRVINAQYNYINPKPTSGVFILGTDNKLYKENEWNQSNDNAVGVVILEKKVIIGKEETTSAFRGYWPPNRGTYIETEYEASKWTDGSGDTYDLVKTEKELPAANWCYGKEITGHSRCYLPALGELHYIDNYRNEIDKLFIKIGSASISNKEYWSSTLWDNERKYAWTYNNGYNNFVQGEAVKYVRRFCVYYG